MKRPANDNRPDRHVLTYVGERLVALKGWRRNGLLMLLGAMLTLALPPFFAWGFLLLVFPGLIWLTMHAPSGKRAFWDGWWFGFGHFTTGLYWFAHALLVDAAKFGWMIPFAVFGISAILGIYTGLATWLAALLNRHDRLNWLVGFPTIWTAVEWVRGTLFTGFPWNLTGYVFNATEPSLQAASLVGAYGLSWLAVCMGSLPILFMLHDEEAVRGKHRFVAGAMVALFAALISWGTWRLQHSPTEFEEGVTLRIVQPAIDQYHKSQPAERENILRQEAELTLRPGIEGITHVIWPETAMPFYFNSGDARAQGLASLLPPNALLLTGIVRPEFDPQHEKLTGIFNSFLILDARGDVTFAYDKRKLVPFGEFVPFRHILPLDKITPGALDFTPGRTSGFFRPQTGPSFFPLICYESIFPHLSDGAWPLALLNVTNDGWFGHSTGPYQHLEMSRMRAVEQGVAFIRAANSGVSGVFDPYGRSITLLGLGETGILDSPLPKAIKSPTFYGLYGDLILLLLLMVALWVVLLRRPGKLRMKIQQ